MPKPQQEFPLCGRDVTDRLASAQEIKAQDCRLAPSPKPLLTVVVGDSELLESLDDMLGSVQRFRCGIGAKHNREPIPLEVTRSQLVCVPRRRQDVDFFSVRRFKPIGGSSGNRDELPCDAVAFLQPSDADVIS